MALVLLEGFLSELRCLVWTSEYRGQAITILPSGYNGTCPGSSRPCMPLWGCATVQHITPLSALQGAFRRWQAKQALLETMKRQQEEAMEQQQKLERCTY